MLKNETIAMLLAGGQGSRLRMMTKNLAKPAVPFGGQYRIIDFSLSNCVNSGIDTVGVLTQYKPQVLNSYIGVGSAWDLAGNQGGVNILPPYVGEKGGQWYKGTAHAVYQNISFIDLYDPDYVLILSGDHIYKMDYGKMLDYHKAKKADVTIGVIEVPWDDASRFGIMNTRENGQIVEFEEKPENPKSNLASMGVYIFNKETLKSYLKKDADNLESDNDFGKNVIPLMLTERVKMFAFPYTGYWRDVGTIESYWMASMDVLDDKTDLDLFDTKWRIYTMNSTYPPHYISASAQVSQSMISEGCMIFGHVDHSIIFPGTEIGEGTLVKDSVIMSHVKIGDNVTIQNAIIGENTVLGEGSIIGGDPLDQQGGERGSGFPRITVVEENLILAPHSRIGVLIRMKRTEKKLVEVAGV